MDAIQIKFGPWAHNCPPHWGMTHVKTCDAPSRLSLVKRSEDSEWLLAVIKDRDTQMSVRQAADRRLRKLRIASHS